VGLHAGLPWLEEFMALMLKHPNFFVTTSTYAPRDCDSKFVSFINGKGQEKVIFGSGAPMVKGGIKGYLSGIQDLGLSEQTLSKYFQENAQRVFKL
jgi:predicted TIM-barrel fold metal-dependent hydrolase